MIVHDDTMHSTADCPRCGRVAEIATMVTTSEGGLVCADCGGTEKKAAMSGRAGGLFAVGCAFLFFGAGSFVLLLFGANFKILAWIDSGGPTVGLAIRAGLILVGLALLVAGAVQSARSVAAR